MSLGVVQPLDSEQKRGIAEEMEQTRARTLALAEAVPEDSAHRQVHAGYSPFDWHLGHVALIEAQWVLRNAAGQPSPDPDLDFIFSNVPENPKAGRVHLPDRRRTLRYLESVRKRTLEFLAESHFDSPEPLLRDGYCFRFALAHEWQHQETLVEMLHLMDGVRRIPPLSPPAEPAQIVAPSGTSEEIFVPAGEFTRGTDDVHAYDNERPANVARTAAFAIDVRPVTAAQFQQFMDDGGYRRRAFWDEQGWAWLQAGGIDSPEYAGRGPFGPRVPDPAEPVASVSWYEASAY
ncbi:MAG: SUMF1/EgtB/PvdO family nonheme iron enzyme [Chloroflexi bacterium]|nr:SUMF1/EgtB/PvdO family nonheme iron enzyme [Chloroflexota bacterium]